jgi:hypothetical protein
MTNARPEDLMHGDIVFDHDARPLTVDGIVLTPDWVHLYVYADVDDESFPISYPRDCILPAVDRRGQG